jgi:methyl-accepting chemotaxis protein
MNMEFKSLTSKTILAILAMDVLFIPVVTIWYLDILGIGGARSGAIAIAVFAVLRAAIGASHTRATLRAYELCLHSRPAERTADMVLRADETSQRMVTRISFFFAISWATMFSLAAATVHLWFGHGLVFTSAFWEVVAIAFVGIWCGAFCAVAPVAALLTDSAAGECSSMARELGITLPRSPESLQTRIGFVAFVLALGPTMCFIALGYAKQVENHEQQNRTQAELYLGRLTDRFDPRMNPIDQRRVLTELEGSARGIELALLDRRGRFVLPDAEGEVTTPPYGAQVAERAKGAARGVIRDSGKAAHLAFQRLDGGITGVAKVDVPASARTYVLGASILAIVISIWAPFCALLLGRAITGPLERLIRTTEKIVEEGKQSEMSALPVVRNDEVGRLSARFNDLIEMMRDLSRAADAIANGELRVEISRKGELPDAFRRMLDSLRSMVREIRGTSVDLASAATEILAASQEQESAAASQSSAMEEINRTMESLAASAAHVSDSVQGVVANAEQTLSTTDRMVSRITELSAHANRIGEILDVIREIADRSDLLALNGSLEASRAGDSGHGFALVATEMRRLAERVTASVEDVKKLVGDIRDSGSSTVAATEEGRRLADGTTEAARQITFVTQQQRSGTEQVSESIRNITDVVTQAVSATAQTRTSAQGLKSQADRLAALVKRFELEPGGVS